MLAISIKNSILILLIVLILHFLIKNALMDKTNRTPKKEAVIKEPFENVPKPATEVKSQPLPVETKACDALPERNTQEEKDELLKYVFGAEAKDCDEEINKYFQGLSPDASATSPATQTGCPLPRTDANALPLSTTCDPALLAFPKDTKKMSEKCVKQDTNQGMLLHQYEDENPMNGGLFGGLNPFDNFSSSYEEYAACT